MYVYGWDRLSPRMHLLIGIPIAVTGFLGSWMVLLVNAWTNHPSGLRLVAGRVVDLSIALIVAALGIVIRGAAYAVSAGTSAPRQVRDLDFASAVSSIVTPFALGACVCGIASGRVPYGKPQGASRVELAQPDIGGHLRASDRDLRLPGRPVYRCDDAAPR